ncbi:MAG: hydroxyisourate hydrolase, partial [Microbacteriaceae bacterium]
PEPEIAIEIEIEPEIEPEPALATHAGPEPAVLYVNSRLSTHVVNATSGTPAAGMGVALLGQSADNVGSWIPLAVNVTDAAGRIGQLSDGPLQPGTYRLLYDTGAYWQLQDVDSFYPEIVITFTVAADSHLHLPLSLSPFAFSTYRGS